MKQISDRIKQFFTTFYCIIKDARTWLLGLALTALSQIPAAFPAITYANYVTAEWIEDKATSVYNYDGYSSFFDYLDLTHFSEIVKVYMNGLELFQPVFIVAAAIAVLLTFCLMAIIQSKEKN